MLQGSKQGIFKWGAVFYLSLIHILGITNIRFLPDVANFKRLFKIPMQGGKLGLAEKSASRKMLMQDYGCLLYTSNSLYLDQRLTGP